MKRIANITFMCFVAIFFGGNANAQTAALPKTNLILHPLAQTPTGQTDAIANELALLRKSLQTLNTRLESISEELLGPSAKDQDESKALKEVSNNLDLLTHSEERAEVLRKLLFELIEKETAYRTRMTQMDEDQRPENIERALSGIGTTRTVEMRETRRRSLESERRGLESLLSLTSQSRARLEEDVKQADLLVSRFRQRLFPLIEKQIEKIRPQN